MAKKATAHKPDEGVVRLIRAHRNIKSVLDKMKKGHKKAEEELQAKLDKVDTGLLRYLNKHGIDQFKVKGAGLVHRKDKEFFPVDDWGQLWEHIQGTGDFDLLQKRVALGGMRTYREENNGATPPGVGHSIEQGVAVKPA